MPHRRRISVKSSASVEEEIMRFILAKKAKGLAAELRNIAIHSEKRRRAAIKLSFVFYHFQSLKRSLRAAIPALYMLFSKTEKI